MSRPECRRCQSTRVLMLDKGREEDNYVYRCRDCGYLFSPPRASASQTRHTAMESGQAGGSPQVDQIR